MGTSLIEFTETVLTLFECLTGTVINYSELPSVGERIKYTVNFVEEITGLGGFGRYLATVLEMDAFLLNEDRHTNNLAVIRNDTTKAFRLCPLFDHGLSLLSDTNDYPPDQDVYACMERVKAKPYSEDFQEQAEAAAEFYGSDLYFTCPRNGAASVLAGLGELYDEQVLLRAERIIRERTRQCSYLFPM